MHRHRGSARDGCDERGPCSAAGRCRIAIGTSWGSAATGRPHAWAWRGFARGKLVADSIAVKTGSSRQDPSDAGRHRLAPLLAPRSLALVGASPKPDSVGQGMIAGAAGFPGRLYLVNPGYREIGGVPCYPSLAALPEPVEHVALGGANARLEPALGEAIAAGARAATIFGSGYLADDGDPPLTQRLATQARGAGMAICGGNGMGFYNLDAGVKVCGFPPPHEL